MFIIDYSWEEIIHETKNAGGKIYSAPFGDYQHDRFVKIEVHFEQLHSDHFFSLEQCKQLDLDEDYFVIRRLMDVYQSTAKIPPVILTDEFNVIDGSHRISAMNELGYNTFFAYVLKK